MLFLSMIAAIVFLSTIVLAIYDFTHENLLHIASAITSEEDEE